MSSPLDMSPAVAMLAFDAITILRSTSAYNENGVLVVEDPEEIPLVVNWQLLGASAGQNAGGRAGLAGSTGYNVEQTRNGQRTYGAAVFFSTTEVFAANEGGQQSDDVVGPDGVTYSISHVEPWISSNYWRAVCVKKEV